MIELHKEVNSKQNLCKLNQSEQRGAATPSDSLGLTFTKRNQLIHEQWFTTRCSVQKEFSLVQQKILNSSYSPAKLINISPQVQFIKIKNNFLDWSLHGKIGDMESYFTQQKIQAYITDILESQSPVPLLELILALIFDMFQFRALLNQIIRKKREQSKQSQFSSQLPISFPKHRRKKAVANYLKILSASSNNSGSQRNRQETHIKLPVPRKELAVN